MRIFLLFTLAALCAIQAAAQQFRKPVPSYHIYRASGKITMDGKPDEPAWQSCETADSFYQTYPTDTCYSHIKTEVRLTFDNDYLYVSAVCHDTVQGRYIVYSLRRDFSYPKNDAFAFYVDPSRDKTNGFNFSLSPLGVQREGIISGGGGQGVTTAWDNIWYSAVSNEKDKWTLEMAIPFKSIRYKPEDKIWGMNMARQDLKTNENTTWSPVQRNVNISSLLFEGNLVWEDAPPKAGLNVTVIPYIRANFNHYPLAEPKKRYTQNLTGGGDVKVGVTSALNLDVTVNPDFSEADVDEQVINLDRFSIFFPEKRTFFQENSDLFAFYGFTHIRPFFSRRIGLNGGRIIPILGGARLSGKLDKNWRIGVMDMQTGAVDSLRLPGENYSVAAFQRQVGKASNIGAIVVNSQAFDNGFERKDYNRLAGLDYNFASANNVWRGKAFFHYSFSPGAKPVNPFAHATWLMYLTRKADIQWNHEYVGRDYRADVGYVPRHNYWRLEPSANFYFYPKAGRSQRNSHVNRWGPTTYMSLYTDPQFRVTDNYLSGGARAEFQNTASLSWNVNSSFVQLQSPFDPSGTGQIPHPAGSYRYHSASLSFISNYRKLFSYELYAQYGSYFTGSLLQYSVLASYRWQPRVVFSIKAERNEFRFPAPYHDASLMLVGPKLDISFSRSLFLTSWVQYNEQLRNINVNARLQWRFRPMSDLFIVYNRNAASQDLGLLNQNIILKLNWWVNL